MDILVENGLVRRLAGPGGRHEYVLDKAGIFSLVDQLRRLTEIEASPQEPDDSDRTCVAWGKQRIDWVERPRLLTMYGPEDGRAFPLRAEPGQSVVVGRSAEADLRLEHDPFISARHLRFERDEAGFRIQDLGSRNGTLLNGRRMGQAVSRVENSDVLSIGRTRLLLQM